MLRFCNEFETDLIECFFLYPFRIINLYLISCDALQADDVAAGQIMLDIAYQLQEEKGRTHCCAFVFGVAFFFV